MVRMTGLEPITNHILKGILLKHVQFRVKSTVFFNKIFDKLSYRCIH